MYTTCRRDESGKDASCYYIIKFLIIALNIAAYTHKYCCIIYKYKFGKHIIDTKMYVLKWLITLATASHGSRGNVVELLWKDTATSTI